MWNICLLMWLWHIIYVMVEDLFYCTLNLNRVCTRFVHPFEQKVSPKVLVLPIPTNKQQWAWIQERNQSKIRILWKNYSNNKKWSTPKLLARNPDSNHQEFEPCSFLNGNKGLVPNVSKGHCPYKILWWFYVEQDWRRKWSCR